MPSFDPGTVSLKSWGLMALHMTKPASRSLVGAVGMTESQGKLEQKSYFWQYMLINLNNLEIHSSEIALSETHKKIPELRTLT